MDDIINNLIQLDKKARDIVEEAQGKSQDIINSIKDEKKDFEVRYTAKTKKRLETIRKEESQILKDSCRVIKDRYEVMMEKLEKAYAQNHKYLKQEIFNKVIDLIIK